MSVRAVGRYTDHPFYTSGLTGGRLDGSGPLWSPGNALVCNYVPL